MNPISKSILSKASAAFMLLSFAACGTISDISDDLDKLKNLKGPVVLSVTPVSGATDVPLNEKITATFSEEMDAASVTEATTFTVTSGEPAVAVEGFVFYDKMVVVFKPAALLASDTTYKATIATTAKNVAGDALLMKHEWSFTTGKSTIAGNPVNLASSGDFVILAKTGISLVPNAAKIVTGDIGVSPSLAASITGFGCVLDTTTGDFGIDTTYLVGKCYAPDYVGTANSTMDTPAKMTAAVSDMETAFVDAAGRAPDATELYDGSIGGKTFVAGVYKWGTGLDVQTDIYLTGSETDVWIFQIAQTLNLASGAKVHLAGGALAKNITWQVGTAATLGSGAHLEGVILSGTAINLGTGASVNGRLLSQSAVALDANTVSQPIE